MDRPHSWQTSYGQRLCVTDHVNVRVNVIGPDDSLQEVSKAHRCMLTVMSSGIFCFQETKMYICCKKVKNKVNNVPNYKLVWDQTATLQTCGPAPVWTNSAGSDWAHTFIWGQHHVGGLKEESKKLLMRQKHLKIVKSLWLKNDNRLVKAFNQLQCSSLWYNLFPIMLSCVRRFRSQQTTNLMW